jgi:hypothetical protein
VIILQFLRHRFLLLPHDYGSLNGIFLSRAFSITYHALRFCFFVPRFLVILSFLAAFYNKNIVFDYYTVF